ncbi:MAG: DUF4384 domain-containing protein, partial [Deltaproteobacteria bacterium]|nr:DUF4384 domain-containing protein [Deltaproteobacteria bacterium]
GEIYGNFTWFWAKALSNATRGETWLNVYNRTLAYMSQALMVEQDPVAEGVFKRLVFEKGEAGENGLSFTVMDRYLSDGVEHAKINAGSLIGIEPGSTFAAGPPENPTAILEVVKAEPLKCLAIVTEGEAKVGDAVTLDSWMPPSFKIKVFYRAALPGDAELSGQARRIFRGIGAVEETTDPGAADMVVWILRPENPLEGLNSEGAGIPGPDVPGDASEEREFIPDSDPARDPWVWLAEPSENSFFWGEDKLRAPLTDEGIRGLRDNFVKASRVKSLLELPGPPGDAKLGVDISYLLYEPVSGDVYDAAPEDGRFHSDDDRHWVKYGEVVPGSNPLTLEKEETLIFVKARNNTSKKFYVYAVNIAADGEIIPFLPSPRAMTLTDLEPGAARSYESSGLAITDPEEYVRVIVTDAPFNVSVLSQKGLEVMTRRGGPFIESFLRDRLSLNTTRSASKLERSRQKWDTVLTKIVK